MELEELKEKLPNITDPNLLAAMLKFGTVHVFQQDKVITEPGQFIKMVPVILEGAIKIIRMDEEGKELFLMPLFIFFFYIS